MYHISVRRYICPLVQVSPLHVSGMEVPGPTAAAHLGDGGEGLLVQYSTVQSSPVQSSPVQYSTAAHLGDGGEGLLVLRAGDRQQRVGHRDQACMLTLCDANTAF